MKHSGARPCRISKSTSRGSDESDGHRRYDRPGDYDQGACRAYFPGLDRSPPAGAVVGADGRFQTTEMQSDLHPGGKWMMRGTGVGGKPFTVRGQYREIARPRLLVFTWLPTWQEDATETLVRFDLEESKGGTVVRLTHSGLTSESARSSHRGWPQIL